MNRRDATLIAHLDSLEGRISNRLDAFEIAISSRFDNIDRRLDVIVDSVADLRIALNDHIARGHED